MVRAAASGVVDYSQADPGDLHWRIRHRLLLGEVRRQEDVRHVLAAQQHWLGWLSHGRLTEETFERVKKHAAEAINAYEHLAFPWAIKPETPPGEAGQPATIDSGTARLISAYKKRFQKPAE